LLLRKLLPVRQVPQLHVFRAQLNQNPVQLRVVLDVLDPLPARDLIQRRLRDVNIPAPDQLGHLPVEKGQQQRPDVRPVHIRVRHDDHLVIPQLAQVERALRLPVANPRPDRRDHRPDLGVVQHLAQAAPSPR
jgi:hypothetical protein